jgi:diketogulonate reductase-like aldo/keto reductase
MTIHSVKAGDASIPCLGLGTWAVRGRDCAAAVSAALMTGYRHIDTAAVYDNEEAVGEGIRASCIPRREIFLTTKVSYTGIDDGPLQRSAESSLKRLGVDAVDLLLIHWPNPAIPPKRSMAALVKAKRAGLTKHIGVSNFTLPLFREAISLADEPIVTNQCEYHPRLDQSALVAACRANDAAFTSYCPLGRGGDIFADPAVVSIARRHGKSPAQILLRWQVQQPGVVAIPKSAKPQRIAENFMIFGFALSEPEMKALSNLAAPNGRIVSPSWAPIWDR